MKTKREFYLVANTLALSSIFLWFIYPEIPYYVPLMFNITNIVLLIIASIKFEEKKNNHE